MKLFNRDASIQDAVAITPRVELRLSAKQWQLLWNIKNCENAATEINKSIARYINAGFRGTELVERCHDVLLNFSYFGAADSEPRWVLAEVLRHALQDVGYDAFGHNVLPPNQEFVERLRELLAWTHQHQPARAESLWNVYVQCVLSMVGNLNEVEETPEVTPS